MWTAILRTVYVIAGAALLMCGQNGHFFGDGVATLMSLSGGLIIGKTSQNFIFEGWDR